jgi:hypothetical protein
MTEYSLKRFASGAGLRRWFYAALTVIALALCATGPRAQTSPAPATTDKQSSLMKPFVFLFRQSSPLSDADQKRRAEEVRNWALRQNAEGHKLDPRLLGGEKHLIGPSGKSGLASQAAEGSLTAILFVEARDFAEAVKIAESHPALHYGVITVEVRPWTEPSAAAPKQNGAK